MPFIGVQPASALLTSADIQDGQITEAKIANDAVGNTKLDLSENYAFDGTISVDTLQGKTTASTIDMPSGTTVQVASLSNTGRGAQEATTTSSYSHVDTGWDLTITPKFSSSKILLLGNLACQMGGSNKYGYVTIYRSVGGSNTDIGDTQGYGVMVVESDGGWTNMKLHHLDSPNTTSAITYRIYAKSDGYNDFYIGWSSSTSASTNLIYLTALEIAQ